MAPKSSERKNIEEPLGFRTLESFEEIFWDLLVEGDPEPLAQAIEAGRTSNELSSEQRAVLARLVRGQSARKRGQSPRDFIHQDVNHTLCVMIAYYHGATGMPIYGEIRPGRGETCCDKFALDMNMPPDTVRDIWKRAKRSHDFSEYIEAGKRARETYVPR